MIIKSFKASEQHQAAFYIARVGQVGKPLREPYTSNNCFMVFSDNPEHDFQLVKSAYATKRFNSIAYGSCQPFIRLRDVRNIIDQLSASDKHLEMLSQLERHIDTQEANLKKQRDLLLSLQQSILAA